MPTPKPEAPKKRWWADTLFKRLFVLMWLALVLSHLCALFVVSRFGTMHGGPGGGPVGLPVLSSLPPGGPVPDERMRGPGPGPGGPPPGVWPRADGSGRPLPPSPRDGPSADPGDRPTEVLWLDYFVRFAVIGVAAWFGARWLSAPMRKLTAASETLGRDLASHKAPVPLDEQRGTLEVRQTAQVFNTMAQSLRAQFDAQGLLMAAISHDLRTPLTRLRLRLEQLEGQPQAARCIEDVQEMDALIGSVLGMMRDRHATEARQRIDAHALLQSLADDLHEQGQPVSVLPLEGGTAAPIVLVRPTALRRVIGNLLGNALRHGGSARVAVHLHEDEVHLLIEDDGPGIAAEQLEAVFQPFYRADPSRGAGGVAGSGLGLHIARDLVNAEGGQLALANRPEGGLRATVVLDLA
ncbi:MAG: ATP-binding protein [Burkholderiaceae bacterium]